MVLLPTQYGASGTPSSWAHDNKGFGHKKRVFTSCPAKGVPNKVGHLKGAANILSLSLFW
jgi:hypothetical protein